MDGGGENCRVGEMAWELYHHRRRRRRRIRILKLKLIGEEHLSATVAMGWEIFELPSSCHYCRRHLRLDFDDADPSASMEMSLQICPRRRRLCSTTTRAIGPTLAQAWLPIIPIRLPMPIMHRREIYTLESRRDRRGFQHYCWWCCRRRRRNTAPWLDV